MFRLRFCAFSTDFCRVASHLTHGSGWCDSTRVHSARAKKPPNVGREEWRERRRTLAESNPRQDDEKSDTLSVEGKSFFVVCDLSSSSLPEWLLKTFLICCCWLLVARQKKSVKNFFDRSHHQLLEISNDQTKLIGIVLGLKIFGCIHTLINVKPVL